MSPAETFDINAKQHRFVLTSCLVTWQNVRGNQPNGHLACHLRSTVIAALELGYARDTGLIILTIYSTNTSSWLQLLSIIVLSLSRVVLDHKLHLLIFAYSLQSHKILTCLSCLLRWEGAITKKKRKKKKCWSLCQLQRHCNELTWPHLLFESLECLRVIVVRRIILAISVSFNYWNPSKCVLEFISALQHSAEERNEYVGGWGQLECRAASTQLSSLRNLVLT